MTTSKPNLGSAADENKVMIQDCMDRLIRLNDWERGFINDLHERRRYHLSTAQQDKLDAVWEKATAKD